MPELFSLEGRFVQLLPMSLDHADVLLAAASGDRSTYDYAQVPWDQASALTYVEKAMAHHRAGDQVPFVTYSTELRRIVGATRFYDLTPWDWSSHASGSESFQRVDRPDVASIGYTWLDPLAQRTPVNTEAKLLMLDHAFEEWQVWAVKIQTDARNQRSRTAIERIGFSLDGVIRADMPGADGAVRDSAVFSMVADEWPAVRRRLLKRLGL